MNYNNNDNNDNEGSLYNGYIVIEYENWTPDELSSMSFVILILTLVICFSGCLVFTMFCLSYQQERSRDNHRASK